MSRKTTTTRSTFSSYSSRTSFSGSQQEEESANSTGRSYGATRSYEASYVTSTDPGRIETMLMSKDKTTLEVKLNKRRETLQLEPFTDESWSELPHGKGPKQTGSKARTQDLGQIFRNKESLAELEEKKSLEKIQPNLERVESVKKKLEVSKKAGLPVTLGLRDLEGTYGHLVTGIEGDVTFRAETPDELLDENECISGQFFEIEKRFVPGRLVEPQKFLPGIVTRTNKGPRFVAGQILNTKKGQRFFPGQYYGNQFVPGQIIKQPDGESRFIPGQVIDALEAGPTFIPGQVMSLNGHDSFVPGQVIEVNGQPRFVPGRVIEEDGTIKFQSGELVDTDEGLKWVQFNLQELDADEGVVADMDTPTSNDSGTSTLFPPDDPWGSFDSLRPMTPSDRPRFDTFSGMMESGALQSLLLAGVEVGDRIVVPSVEVELSEDMHQNRPKLQRSVSVNTFSLFNRVLSSMHEAMEGIDPSKSLDVNHILEVVKTAQGGCEVTKSLVLTAIGEIIRDSGGEGIEMSPEELKRRVLEKVQVSNAHSHPTHKGEEIILEEESSGPTSSASQLKSVLSSYRRLLTKRVQEQRIRKILSKRTSIDENSDSLQMKEVGQKLAGILCQTGTLLNSALTSWLSNQENLTQALNFCETDEVKETAIEERLKSTIYNVTQLESLDSTALAALVNKGIEVATLMDDKLILAELMKCQNIQTSSILFRKLNAAALGSLQEVILLNFLPESVGDLKTRLAYSEELLEFGRGKPTLPKSEVTTTPVPPDMRKVEELVNEMIGWDACVIMKNDLHAIVPKEATSKILSGQARYSVLDDSGIRFFEPPSPRGKTLLKSFSEEISGQGVHITEVTTPEADAMTTQNYEGSFRRSFKGSDILEADDLELPSENILDSSVAKSKLAVKQTGKRRATSPREQVERRTSVKEERDASIRELVETEEEFLRDMDNLLKIYYKAGEEVTTKYVSESRDVIFGCLPKIAEFHRTLLLEALKANTDNTKLLGRAFIRLEREFDVHAKYIEEESTAEKYLKENPEIAEFYQDLCLQVDSTKSLTEQLRLPNQRLNDYSVLLQELVEFSKELNEPTTDLEKALELMKLLPQKSGDDKFLKNIEGYKGSMKGLGRLLSHEWFSLTDTTGVKRERYLFLFKGRILVTKVRRITDDRSVFILKDVLRLPDLEVISDDSTSFDLHEPSTGGKYHLAHADPSVKEKWLIEVKGYASDPTARAKRQDSVTVDTTFGMTNSSDEEKSDTKGRKVNTPTPPKVTAQDLTKSSSNVVMVKRESLKSESEKAPRIIVGMKSMACEPGDSAKFHAKFISESPSSVSWLKDNKPLDDRLADRIRMTAIGNDFTMELLNCHDDDAGLYTARCINEFGSKTSSGMLSVHELTPEERAARMAENSPGFPVKFKDVAVIRDTVACFMIATSGDPLPKLRIYKNGEVLQFNDRVKLEEGEEPGHYDLFINHVVPEDEGVYKIVGSNIYGSESFSAKLDVVEEKDVFHGLDPGSAPLDFTWFRDGKHFTPEERFKVMFRDDEDTLALLFQHVTPEDAGLYTCVASTNSGKISCSAELTVKGAVHQLLKEPAPPVIKTKLMPTELNATGSGMLEITAEGFPQPILTWFKDDTEIVAGDKYRFLHEDAESTALIIRNVDVSDAGQYKVVATNELGRDESEAPVIVRAPPKFTKEMKDCSVLRGSQLVMEISVEGSPAPELKLYKDGQDLSKNKLVTVTKTKEVYKIRIESVEKTDAGSYSAVASNSVGQMSCFWSVEVNSPPKIISTFEKRIEKEVGETLILEFETEEVEKKITWKIDEEVVDKKQKTSSDGRKHRIEWKDLGRTSSSKISATVSNDFGSDTSQTELVMRRKPEIIQKLKPVVTNYGENAEFKVKVDAYPKPKVKWFLGDVVIDGKKYGEDGDTYSVKIPKVEASGTIKVKVENDYGYDEDSAELTVTRKPEFTKGLKDVTVLEAESLDMAINIVGTPTPNLRMFHNGKEVEASARVKITKESTETYHMTFNVVLPSDGGDWMIKATNDSGDTESRCKITVEGKPIFEQKLANTIEVIENENLELTVTIRGNPEPVIKWILNKEELKVSKHVQIVTDGESHNETFASRLVINKVTMEEGGEISVVAENKHGASTSSGVVKVIALADIKGPKITTPLESANFVKGEDGELKAVVRGDPPPTAEWFKDGASLGPGKRTGESYSLPLKAVSEASAGKYELVMKNDFGEARSQAQVAVLCKPEIMGLESLRLSPGEPVVLTARVSGNPQVSLVEWLKDGLLVPETAGQASFDVKEGVATLSLGPAQKSSQGCYSLRAKSDIGETVVKAQVAVQLDPPVFIRGLTNTEVKDGEELILKCKVTGTPKPEISWTKDGVPITEGISEQDGVSVYTCEIASTPQMGKYKVEAVNSGGMESSEAIVKMTKEKPKFVKSLPRRQSFTEGEPMMLKIKVDGSPKPSVAWLKDGIPIEPSDDLEIHQLPDGTCTLQVSNAKPSDRGTYSVILENPEGKVESASVVDVHGEKRKPEFLENLSGPSHVSAGQPFKLTAKVDGYPQPEVKWQKDGRIVRPSSRILGHIGSDGVVSLEILNPTDSDTGTYKLILFNDKGEVAQEILVNVETQKSEIPSFLKKINNTELYDGMDARFTGTTVAILACVTGNPEPEYEWFKDGIMLSPGPRVKFEKEGAGLLRLIVSKVTPEDAGTYGLRIFNKNGEAKSEGKLKVEQLEIPRRQRPSLDDTFDYVKVKKSALPYPLTDRPIISSMSDRHLTLSWKPSLSSVARYPVTYVVEMCEVGGTDPPKADWFVVRRGLRNCVCDVRNLDPWLDYKFRIRVENEYGISEPSPYAITLRSTFDRTVLPWSPLLTHPIPKDYNLEIPPRDGYTFAPRFLEQPYDTQYGIRDSCSKLLWFVYGYPKPLLEFDFNGINITHDIGGGHWATTYLNNGEVGLFVTRMTPSIIGTYTAIARNPYGEARQEVHLKLAEQPRFLERPKETWLMIRKDGKAMAKVTGTPLPHIKFYKDWTPIGESSRLRFKIHEHLEGGYVLVTLELRDSIGKDTGLYSITATNLAGTTHTSFNIRIEESEIDYNWGAYGPPREIKTRSRPFFEYYDLGDELGRGTQGVTYHVVERGTGRSFACKSMFGTGQYRDWMENEVNIMDGLSHRHITRLHDWYSEPNGIRLVTELGDGGGLIGSLISRTDVTEWEISSYIRQLLLGLQYLHGSGIAHLGLTPFDILMSRQNGREIMITDFGLARRIGLKLHPLDYGMPEFVAPEIMLGRGVGYGADIWSVGVITHLLLTGKSLFWGRDDVDTMEKIKSGTWNLCETLSLEARDFLNRLLVFEAEGRLDIESCLNHSWLTRRSDRSLDVTTLTTKYYDNLRSWYSNANCRDTYRRRPLSGAYTHPSRMVYPPGEWTPPRHIPTREPHTFQAPETIYPRPNLDTEIGLVSSESHYQNGPDTYLLQLRDADFPARLRKYMKVAAARSPAMALQLKGAAYDTERSVIKERRRFTEIMDEEVDDERRTKINSYGEPRRLRTEVGQHMEVQAEAAALVLSKREGSVPLFRIRPAFFIGGSIGHELNITVVVDGDPVPTVQWFKNDLVVGESNRLKTIIEGNCFKLSIVKLLAFDFGAYKVVAGNANGQVTARFRVQEAEVPGQSTRKMILLDYVVEEQPLCPVKGLGDVPSAEREIYSGKFSKIMETSDGKIMRWSKGYEKELDLIGSLKNANLCNPISLFEGDGNYRVILQDGGGNSLLRVLSNSKYSEQTLCIIVGQLLDAINYLHWRGFALLNLEPGNVLLSSVDDPVAKLCDFSSLQPISRLGSRVQTFTPTEFTAPELLSSEPAYRTTDVWNVGVLLYILLSGHSPFLGDSEEDTKANVTYVRFRFEYLFKDLTQEVTRFIMLLFKKSPLKRPSIEECLEHRWLLPSEYMLKKREKSCFAAGLLRQYTIEYFEKRKGWWDSTSSMT